MHAARDEAIVAHYTESDVYRAHANARALARAPRGIDPEWLRPFFECRPEYARASLAALRARWGDVDRYALEGLGISATELGSLRSNLVEPATAASPEWERRPPSGPH